jgi:hypothetical protein
MPMNFRKISTVCAALLATAASYGQSATLTPLSSNASGGAVVTLSAAASYTGRPGAVGWMVTLPEGWSYVGTAGLNPPQVAPQEGATGTLEWAYTTVPPDAGVFIIVLKAGRRTGPAILHGRVLLRADGKQHAVEVAPAIVAVSA